ncbi:unnamed protein product [Anisakis simplex]|uniref:Uncharacterized protein n=1 Tax=Anisakis simplex TaxID=6269 RepID=A0A0M3KHD0_ANISI|nr:unnamed protein product [Anisakis simplex]
MGSRAMTKTGVDHGIRMDGRESVQSWEEDACKASSIIARLDECTLGNTNWETLDHIITAGDDLLQHYQLRMIAKCEC